MEDCAKKGGVIAYRDLSALLGNVGTRRGLVDILDRINEQTCRKDDILLSAVVVGDNDMPDSGFFDKFRAGRWPLSRWKDREREGVDSRAIFREELAAVYECHNAPVRVHVLIDLENNPTAKKWKGALAWLKTRGYRRSGSAFTKLACKPSTIAYLDREHNIDFCSVPEIEKRGQEADAAILVEFGRMTRRITTRDFVCFMATSDRIYKAASEIALRENMRVLRFCDSKTREWKPKKSEGVYCALDINAPQTWDAEMDKLVGS